MTSLLHSFFLPICALAQELVESGVGNIGNVGPQSDPRADQVFRDFPGRSVRLHDQRMALEGRTTKPIDPLRHILIGDFAQPDAQTCPDEAIQHTGILLPLPFQVRHIFRVPVQRHSSSIQFFAHGKRFSFPEKRR